MLGVVISSSDKERGGKHFLFTKSHAVGKAPSNWASVSSHRQGSSTDVDKKGFGNRGKERKVVV